MRQRIILLVILFLLTGKLTFCLPPESLPGILENIVLAIKSGNSKSLAGYFNSTVEITLPGKEGTFSKVQAEMIMKDFFLKNPPASYIVDQKGSSSGGAQFIIGTYKSSNKVYKTYILLKPTEGQTLIQQLQFEID
jgi:hypothetical protein